MNDAINRALGRRARQILRIEQWLVVLSAAATVVLLAAALYFEYADGVPPYSLAVAAVFLLVSSACFRLLFGAFGEGYGRRASKKRTRTMFTLASGYIALATLVAYAVAFGLFGLPVPWAGPDRTSLYACYFLLAVAAVFLARSIMFYWRLRAYLSQSLGSLIK